MRKSTGNNAPVRPLAPKASGGGSGKMITKIRKIAAPTPPANASMSSMGGKLKKGNA